jgi:hypothetical protein
MWVTPFLEESQYALVPEVADKPLMNTNEEMISNILKGPLATTSPPDKTLAAEAYLNCSVKFD